MIPGRSTAPGTPAASPNGTAPRCEHLDGLAGPAAARPLPGLPERGRPPGRPGGLPGLRPGRLLGRLAEPARQGALRGDGPPGRRRPRAGSGMEMVLRPQRLPAARARYLAIGFR
jgi:hypothetical protein